MERLASWKVLKASSWISLKRFPDWLMIFKLEGCLNHLGSNSTSSLQDRSTSVNFPPKDSLVFDYRYSISRQMKKSLARFGNLLNTDVDQIISIHLQRMQPRNVSKHRYDLLTNSVHSYKLHGDIFKFNHPRTFTEHCHYVDNLFFLESLAIHHRTNDRYVPFPVECWAVSSPGQTALFDLYYRTACRNYEQQ